jgi:hypothetical protein
MALTSLRKFRAISRNSWNLRFPVALLFVFALTGCNTCVTFISNPPTGTLGIVASDPRPACNLPKMNAAVRPQLAAEPVCSSCVGVGSGQVQHIFLTIRSIELNSSATAHDDSPDWQELLPLGLEQNPLQIDLMEGKADQTIQAIFGKTVLVPAGIYHQLRLRLVPNQPAEGSRLPEKNACGSKTFNCIVTSDGGIQPLQPDDGSSELRIASDKMEGGSLSFFPDTGTDLIIEWKLAWELSSSADIGVRLLPALAGSAKVRRIKLDELGTPEDEVVSDSP